MLFCALAIDMDLYLSIYKDNWETFWLCDSMILLISVFFSSTIRWMEDISDDFEYSVEFILVYKFFITDYLADTVRLWSSISTRNVLMTLLSLSIYLFFSFSEVYFVFRYYYLNINWPIVLLFSTTYVSKSDILIFICYLYFYHYFLSSLRLLIVVCNVLIWTDDEDKEVIFELSAWIYRL